MKYYGCYNVTADVVNYLNNITEDKTLFTMIFDQNINNLKNTPVFPMEYAYYYDIIFLDKISLELTDGFLGKRECLKI